MSVASTKFRTKFLQRLPILALTVLSAGASSAWASVPAVVIDAQQTLTTGFVNPTAIAGNNTNQKAIFIADTNNNRIIAYVFGGNYLVQPTGFTLVGPGALALDSSGNLFIGDTPSPGVGRVIEMFADNAGNLTGAAQQVAGAPLANPVSLAVDASGTLFIGDYSFATLSGAIYSLPAGSPAPLPVAITGLPVDFFPGKLLRDSSTNLYLADNGDSQGSNGGIYTVPANGGAAQPLPLGSFVPQNPSGLALNAAGDLYILTAFAANTGPAGSQVLIVPAASPSTPYVLPSTGIAEGGDLVFDSAGNLDVTDSFNGVVSQMAYGTSFDIGHTNVGQTGQQIQLNVEFNAPATLRGFRVVTQGDVSTELTQVSAGNCTNGPKNSSTVNTPFLCTTTYQGAAAFPGLRESAVLVRGPGNTILASAAVNQTGFAGEEITYPLRTVSTATGLQQPQALAISGLNKTVYVADSAAGQVYSTGGLAGTTLTPVSTGSFTLQAPDALAIDGAGNLFIADFNLGELIEVPTATGAAPSMLIPPGGLLQHPMALTIDTLGNLYVGDAGPGGSGASNGNPGYIVKLPVGGIPFKLNIPSVAVVFPQALTIDYYTNNLYIGDGGDLSGTGQVVGVASDLSGAGVIPVPNVTNPTGLVFGPTGALSVLDGTTNAITVYPIDDTTATAYVLPLTTNPLIAASALAGSAGGQSFVVADIGAGNNNTLVFLNGDRSTLAFGSLPVGTQSQPLTATEYNIGNLNLTLGNPFYSSPSSNTAFSILGSSTCGANLTLAVSGSCTINVEFTPAAVGQTTQQIMVKSTGYNTGVPILTLRGTGKPAGGVVKRPRK